MTSTIVKMKNMVESMNLTMDDVPIIYSLPSHHELTRQVRQRQDTKQFIYIESESCAYNKSAEDDYFQWHYITESEAENYGKKRTNI